MYDSAGRTATLTVEGPDGEREEGPFDLVILASQASEPNIPEIPGIDQVGGKVLHTTQFKREEFDEIVTERKKVSCVQCDTSSPGAACTPTPPPMFTEFRVHMSTANQPGLDLGLCPASDHPCLKATL